MAPGHGEFGQQCRGGRIRRHNGAMHIDDQELVRRLLAAMDRYHMQNPHYDEVFWQVNGRIQEQGEAGKLELAALISWKRSGQGHWVLELMQRPDAEVRNRSHAVFATGMTDQQRLNALAPLPRLATQDAM